MSQVLEFLLTYIWPLALAALHVVLMAVASCHVVLTKRDPRAALGWVGIICLTPIFGTILYVMFGVNRIHRRARSLRRSRTDSEAVHEPRPVSDDVLVTVLGDEATHLAPLSPLVGRLTRLPLLDGNRVTPLISGHAAYDAMLAEIDAAEHSVALMTYIFDNDACGLRFADALERAQQRSVQVRVLIDDVGARYTIPSIRRTLKKRGIPNATFLPTLTPVKLHYTNLRNHRKILVIDGKVGFTGGMNIRQGHLCDVNCKHPVLDLHFRIDGPVVDHLRTAFAADWDFATQEHLDGTDWFPPLAPAGHSVCRGIIDGPEIESETLRLTILGAVGCARHSIQIVTPYFLPDQPLITALNVAAMRGVAVHIVLPEKGNLRLVQWASTAQLWQVLQRGCRVWLTPPPFDHTKVMLVDGAWSLIGSGNWDPRSLRLNFEFNVECYDQELAAELAALIQKKKAGARETTLAEVDGRPLWMRLRDGFCRLAQPYL
ncbi:MAG TPA: cardiolipin synthase [Pirellulaceae bacterium]|nr:cardiolipin synthase [Pirellulaceae bacterium]